MLRLETGLRVPGVLCSRDLGDTRAEGALFLQMDPASEMSRLSMPSDTETQPSFLGMSPSLPLKTFFLQNLFNGNKNAQVGC